LLFAMVGALVFAAIVYAVWPDTLTAWATNEFSACAASSPSRPALPRDHHRRRGRRGVLAYLASPGAIWPPRSEAHDHADIGFLLIGLLVVMVLLGMQIAIALIGVGFVGIWIIRDNIDLAFRLLDLGL
jgi:hypothetical protein